MADPIDDAILVVGEALVDLVPAAGGALVPHPGGGPFNTARTIARLGQPVRFLGTISDDRFGALLRASLAADGVRLDGVVAVAAPTTLAVVELDAQGGAGYRFYASATAAAALTPAAALAVLPDAVALLHVGALGLVLEPLATAVERVVDTVDEDTLVLVDPNVRPAAIADRDAYVARLHRTLARADVVKVSVEDLAWLADGPPVAAARTLLERGPRVALVTAGADGATIVTREAERHVAAPAVDVVDTIGAGDAFGGGLAAWLHRARVSRRELEDLALVEAATTFACEVAARTCARAGAVPPLAAELGLSAR